MKLHDSGSIYMTPIKTSSKGLALNGGRIVPGCGEYRMNPNGVGKYYFVVNASIR